MDLVDVEDSYEKRRHLFKNIWDTAVNLDDKDADITKKPKVIKTLRLDELDRCTSAKKKSLKIKNLRTVCNKLLDFCDKQEADDINEKDGQQSENSKRKKVRKSKVKKKAKKTRSPSPPTDDPTQAKSTPSGGIESEISEFSMLEGKQEQSNTSETKENLDSDISQNYSPSAKSPVHTKNSKQSPSLRNSRISLKLSANRKTVKSSTKKSKLSLKKVIDSSGPKKNTSDVVPFNTPKLLQLHKIDVAYSPPPSPV